MFMHDKLLARQSNRPRPERIVYKFCMIIRFGLLDENEFVLARNDISEQVDQAFAKLLAALIKNATYRRVMGYVFSFGARRELVFTRVRFVLLSSKNRGG
jgi:hypothetical protein